MSSDGTWNRDSGARITRVGHVLRELHLDELPQLFNVLRGDMNLVGPRPEMAENVPEMSNHIPFYAVRHRVRPGLTGWAQVKFRYSISKADVTEKLRYDLFYVLNRSVGLDLRILAITVRVISAKVARLLLAGDLLRRADPRDAPTTTDPRDAPTTTGSRRGTGGETQRRTEGTRPKPNPARESLSLLRSPLAVRVRAAETSSPPRGRVSSSGASDQINRRGETVWYI